MKNYSKIGGRRGSASRRTAYRTPASFRYRKYVKVRKVKERDRYAKMGLKGP